MTDRSVFPGRALRGVLGRFGIGMPKGPAPGDAGLPDATLSEQATLQFYLGRRAIETTIDDPRTARAFMDRVIAQWHALGEAEPFWSNDTQDSLRAEVLTAAKREDFYAGGEGVMRAIEAFESRSGVAIPNGRCMELGAGVGRHTHALARRFDEVVAIDVAAGGLAECEARMRQLGSTNVKTLLLESPDDLDGCGAVDFFLSLSVLQHNPPPVQRLLLNHGLGTLRSGGYALFQTPDWIKDYSFSAAAFAKQGEAMFDLHCLPKTDVLDILEAAGMRLLDFAPDFTIGLFGSYTYFARKH